MSKEELNNQISNSQTENASVDSAFNTQQFVESDLIQQGNETNQFSNETDHKINSGSSRENQDFNLISEDLKNVNKHEDSGSVNEKSALDIKESANLNSSNDQSLSQSNTELNTTEETNFVESVTQASVPKQRGDDLESFNDTEPKSDDDQKHIKDLDQVNADNQEHGNENKGDNVCESVSKTEQNTDKVNEVSEAVEAVSRDDHESFNDIDPKSELQTETENRDYQENIVSENVQSDQDAEERRSKVEGENDGDNVNKKVANLCSDSGPYFSKSHSTDSTKNEESEQKDEPEVTKVIESQSDAKQDNFESSINFPNASDITKEKNNDTGAVNEVSNETKCDTEVGGPETETYEDDFEETTDDDQKHTKDLDQANAEHGNEDKEDSVCESVNKSEQNTDKVNEVSETVVAVSRANEELTHEETDDSKNLDKNIADCETIVNVNEDREEKELTEIVIDEEGIPKVAITTVPDRPPSSLASDSDKADPFEDFQFDTEGSDSNRIESNGTEDIEQTVDGKTEVISDAQKEEDSISDSLIMEKSDKNITDNRLENADKVFQDDDNETNKPSDHIGSSDSGSKEEKSGEQFTTEAKADDGNQKKIEDEGEHEAGENEQRSEASVDDMESQTKEVSKDANDTISDKNADKENTDTAENTHLNKTEEKTKASVNDMESQNNELPKDVNDSVNDKELDKENTHVNKTEERSESPEPISKQEGPLEQMLRRNVTIDGTVDSVTQLESNVTTLLASMKDVMKYYSDLLKLQALKDFTNDLGKFNGDFTSINEAFKSCNSMSLNINQHLKELRHITEDVRTQFHRKFQQEDLSTWIDISPEKEKEKDRLQEEAVAAEKAAMAKAAEARHAVAKAVNGVAEAHQLIAQMETQAADAEAISQKAAAQARSALLAAEEARVAAEERRRAEEAAKKRAEERARIKAAEEEKKKALEEMKIYQDAAAKGTSVEDERKSFMEDKKRKELERKNPKNWPRFSYKTDGIDFNPAVGCIIRAIEGSIQKTDVTCSYVDQSKGVLKLTATEELVSNIIDVKQVEDDRTFSFEEPLSIALPVCIGRIPSGKETVVKQMMPNGAWREIPSADVQFEDYRELKFVEGRCTKFGTFVVVLRPKKDTLQFQKKGSKLLCTSDSRISFSNKPGTFKQNINAVLEVQTLDSNVVPDLKLRSPKECEDLISTSPFIKFSMPVKNFGKPLTVSLPLPQVQTRQKRPATGISRETKSQDLRPATARPAATTEDDTTEQIFFLHRDDKTCWTVNTKMHLVQPKSKDTVTFDITEPYQRMILLRTKAGKSVAAVEKMATLLENITTQRNVKVIARQRNDDVADVMVACTSSNRTEKTLKYMEEGSFTEGPNPSPDIILREGQQLYMKFRGNVECISENPSLSFIFNTNIRTTREFKINEKEEFAQKSLPSFRGFIQVFTKALVPKPIPEDAPKNVQPEMVEAEVLLTELLVELPKPEAEPPKPLATAPLHLKEGPLTSGALRYIAGMLGKEWKEVAAQLDLKPMRIQAILRNHVNKDTPETRFDMLVTWAKRVPKAVDKVQILYNALIACGRPDIAEEVRHRGQQYKQQRFMSARVSHLRQAFVKVAKTTAVFNRWKTFAKDIGVPDDQIKRIDEAGGSGQEKCYTSLETWKDVSGEEATVTSLATYLKTAKQERLSRDVEALVAS